MWHSIKLCRVRCVLLSDVPSDWLYLFVGKAWYLLPGLGYTISDFGVDAKARTVVIGTAWRAEVTRYRPVLF